MINVEKIPMELREIPRWILWKVVIKKDKFGEDKEVKVPVSFEGASTGANEEYRHTWSTLENCVKALEVKGKGYSGLGFVFTNDDDIVGIDLDKCRDEPWAVKIVKDSGTYAELSPSGTGYHMILKGRKKKSNCNDHNGFECYETVRYFAFTGDRLAGVPHEVMSRQEFLDKILDERFPETCSPSVQVSKFVSKGDGKTFQDYGIDIGTATQGDVKTFCPQCSGNRKPKNRHDKSLSVEVQEGIWNCFNCGWCGSLGNKPASTAAMTAVATKGFAKPDWKYHPDLPQKIYDYLVDERAIPESILKRNQVDWHDGCIRFPYFKSGEVVNIKSRTLDKNFFSVKAAEKCVFGYDDIDNKSTIIVEGEFDKLAFEAAGFKNCFSVPGGAPSPEDVKREKKFSWIGDLKERFDDVKEFILATDNDRDGKELELELGRRFGLNRCKRIQFPDGVKDANEMIVSRGTVALQLLVSQAQDYPLEGIATVASLDLDKLYRDGLGEGIPSGWSSLDSFFNLSQDSGDMTLVTGIPGHGKSEWLDALIINLCEEHGWTAGIFSPENFPLEYHVSKLLEKYVGAPFSKNFNKKFIDRMTPKQLEEGRCWMSDHLYFILPPEEEVTLEEILVKAKELVEKKGIKILVIDPWNELDHKRPSNFSETEYISASLSKVRRFARNNNCHVFLVVHPMKPFRNKDGSYPKPSAYDMAGSAHWRNKSDNIVMIWREMNYEKNPNNEVEIHIQKVRKKHLGKVGCVMLGYHYATGRYLETPVAVTNDFADITEEDDVQIKT